MNTAPDSAVPPPPSLDTWAAWVNRVGGQWATQEDLAQIGLPESIATGEPANETPKDQPC